MHGDGSPAPCVFFDMALRLLSILNNTRSKAAVKPDFLIGVWFEAEGRSVHALRLLHDGRACAKKLHWKNTAIRFIGFRTLPLGNRKGNTRAERRSAAFTAETLGKGAGKIPERKLCASITNAILTILGCKGYTLLKDNRQYALWR